MPEIWIGRTGYTGEPLCFELFFAVAMPMPCGPNCLAQGPCRSDWARGTPFAWKPALPLYGHELGDGPDGRRYPFLLLPGPVCRQLFAA